MAEGKKICANMIMEILGRPPEHIKEALTDLVKKLGTEQGIKVIESKIHEPTLVKDSKDIYTTFAEISLEFDSLNYYFGVMFTYMPANIEITSPENLTLPDLELNDLGNKLLSRLHEYDAITKKLIYERKFIIEKLQEARPEMFKKKDEVEKKEESIEKKEEVGNKESPVDKKEEKSEKKKKSKKN